MAQEEPGRISVRLIDVKSDAIAQFEATIADGAKAFEDAGHPAFHVYERIRGEGLPGYTVITLDGAFNDLPPVDVGPAWLDRISHSTNGSSLFTAEMSPELSIASPSGLAPSGEFMTVRVRTVSPANRQAYFDWHANELTPALRQAGLTDMRSGRVIAGGNVNTFIRYSYADSWPAQGLDIAGTVGEREFERIIDRESGLLATAEDIIYQFRGDLSFTAE